jgi:competence protein ComEC
MNFYEVNLLSVFYNIFFIPYVTVVVYPLSLLCFIFPFLSDVFIICINVMEYVSNFLSSVDFFCLYLNFNIVEVIFYYIALFITFYKNNFFFICFDILIILFDLFFPYFDCSCYVYFFDVGQGDSSLVITPFKNETILIDTGGKIDYFNEEWKIRKPFYVSNNYISFLKSFGIRSIDYFVISHGDYDHMGDAINLVKNFKVEKVIFNCGEYNDLEQELIKVLDKKKIPYYSCIKELNIDDNKLYFLNNEDYGNENDNSSVIYTELNNYKFLFMGDAGVEVEADLIDKYNLKDIDVLKVGHHGSKTSSSKNFINEINPKYSIISVGKNNRYGHPNDGVLENLKDSNIYRTDQDGSIMFKIKNNKLQIETCIP